MQIICPICEKDLTECIVAFTSVHELMFAHINAHKIKDIEQIVDYICDHKDDLPNKLVALAHAREIHNVKLKHWTAPSQDKVLKV
ncbi:hypothetical protein LCGC14_0608760 [marine sediment metagenome]|uniref:Uncharacterized protein n=1 Tax=marine sediment metagenome TaxID=412755 RepID=A0A0F9TUP9_9ZZZZ